MAATRLVAVPLEPGALASVLARARLAQGKVLGATQLLDADLTLEAVAAILVENGVTTSAIEGERLDVGAVRSSVARHLGLPTAGLPTPLRAVDGLIEVLLDATRHFTLPDERAPVRLAGLPLPDRLLRIKQDQDRDLARR